MSRKRRKCDICKKANARVKVTHWIDEDKNNKVVQRLCNKCQLRDEKRLRAQVKLQDRDIVFDQKWVNKVDSKLF